MRVIRVLLVDDNAAFLRAAAGFLNSLPRVEVLACATSAAAGLAQVPRLAPDLVLIDVVMPGMSGLEAARRIKECGDRPKTVMLSLHDTEFYRARAKAAGADAFVSKSDFVAELPVLLESLFPGPHP